MPNIKQTKVAHPFTGEAGTRTFRHCLLVKLKVLLIDLSVNQLAVSTLNIIFKIYILSVNISH